MKQRIKAQLYDNVTLLETKILNKIKKLQLKKNKYYCKHYINLQQCEPYNEQQNYQNLFWKRYMLNEMVKYRIQLIKQSLNKTNQQINEIQVLFQKHKALLQGNIKKKNRKKIIQTQRKFKCQYHHCGKDYASQASLNLHIKLKHNGGNKSDRQKTAEFVWQAKEKNLPMPHLNINLPPNFIQEYGRLTNRIPSKHHK